MSHAQDPQRGFFPFGNPFRMLSPKGSSPSPRLLSLLNSFELTLAERLRKLMPKDKDEILTLSWMKLALGSLCETHDDIKSLITDLELPVSDWDDKWIDVYLDISVKLLDLCIPFSSELTRLNQGLLLLQCVLHKLESNCPDQYMRARSLLDSWRQRISTRNPRIGNCGAILGSLVESLDLPKVKNSSKGQVLMRALYGVKVQTVYICSLFATAFSGSRQDPLDLTVSETPLWADAFSKTQTQVNEEINNIFSSGKVKILKELEAVDAIVKKLYPMIEDGFDPIKEELFKDYVSELRRSTEELSQGLDRLSEEVDGFFKIVLTGRDALLCSLRNSGSVPNVTLGRDAEEQVVS